MLTELRTEMLLWRRCAWRKIFELYNMVCAQLNLKISGKFYIKNTCCICFGPLDISWLKWKAKDDDENVFCRAELGNWKSFLVLLLSFSWLEGSGGRTCATMWTAFRDAFVNVSKQRLKLSRVASKSSWENRWIFLIGVEQQRCHDVDLIVSSCTVVVMEFV